MTDPACAPSGRTSVKRGAKRADYAPQTVRAILSEGLLCHVAVGTGEAPFVIPTIFALQGDEIVLHGSTANRVLRELARGAPACVTVTLVDGLVLARSAFHHSVNYRCVVLYGRGRVIAEPEAKCAALQTLIEQFVPGRWSDVRPPSELELARTLVVAIPIEEASAKIRTGPPIEEPDDYALDCWAGVVPLSWRAATPITDPGPSGAPAHETPGYVRARFP